MGLFSLFGGNSQGTVLDREKVMKIKNACEKFLMRK